MKTTDNADHEALLVTADNDIIASLMESLLNTEGIPVLKKYPGASGYMNIYMGISKLGVELYVPSRLLEKAKDLISTFK